METMFQVRSQVKRAHIQSSLAKGIAWGMTGGLVATLVMDLILMGVLWAVGRDPLSCFSIVGNTLAQFFSSLGIETAGGVPAGVATHYIVGPIMGTILAITIFKINVLRTGSIKKRMLTAIVFVEILSQPLLALAPIFLKMSKSETLLWFGGSFIMHFIWGVIYSLVLNRGQKSSR